MAFDRGTSWAVHAPDDATLVILPEPLTGPSGLNQAFGQPALVYLHALARWAGFARVVVFRGAAPPDLQADDTSWMQWTSDGALWSGPVVMVLASAYLSVQALARARSQTIAGNSVWLDYADRPILWTGCDPPPLRPGLPSGTIESVKLYPWGEAVVRVVDNPSQARARASILQLLHGDGDDDWQAFGAGALLQQLTRFRCLPARVELAAIGLGLAGAVFTGMASDVARIGPLLVFLAVQELGCVRPLQRTYDLRRVAMTAREASAGPASLAHTNGPPVDATNKRWQPGETAVRAARPFLHGALVLALGLQIVMQNGATRLVELAVVDVVIIVISGGATALCWIFARSLLRASGRGLHCQLPRLDYLALRLGFAPILGMGRRPALEAILAVSALCGWFVIAWLVIVAASATRMWRWLSAPSESIAPPA